MATIFLTLLLHFAGLTEPETNQPSADTPATYANALQAEGGGGDWRDR